MPQETLAHRARKDPQVRKDPLAELELRAQLVLLDHKVQQVLLEPQVLLDQLLQVQFGDIRLMIPCQTQVQAISDSMTLMIGAWQTP